MLTTSVEQDLLQIVWLKEDTVQHQEKSVVHTGGKYAVTTTADLHVRDVVKSDSEIKYYCKVTNKLTGDSVESNPANILVRPAGNNAIYKAFITYKFYYIITARKSLLFHLDRRYRAYYLNEKIKRSPCVNIRLRDTARDG